MWKLFAMANGHQENSADAVQQVCHSAPTYSAAFQKKGHCKPPMPNIKLSFLRHHGMSTCHTLVLPNTTTSAVTGLCNYHSATSMQAVKALGDISVSVLVLLVVAVFVSLNRNFHDLSLHCHHQLSNTKNVDVWAGSRTVLLISYMVPCHLEKA